MAEDKYQGYLDSDDSEVVAGWAWNASRPDERISVDIYDSDKLIATVPADIFGKDLLDAGIGDGGHRFAFVSPPTRMSRGEQVIHVKFASTGTELTNSPKIVPEKPLEKFVYEAPSAQAAVDIFKGEWASRLPPEAGARAGSIPLFDDPRIAWAVDVVGDISVQRVVELGPLEGGHTYMLSRRGARVVAVEANTRNYLKCLVTKELTGMDAHFLCGDVVEFLRKNTEPFDLCLASGVLYHMQNPAELISLIARSARRILLWTHYYDAEPASKSIFKENFVAQREFEWEGFSHVPHRQEYGDVFFAGAFCGGIRPWSAWMSRADILRCLDFFGFKHILGISFENRTDPKGASFFVVGAKSS